MDSRELDQMAKIMKIKGWKGVFDADEITKIPVKSLCVVNCCVSNSGAKGHHWLAVYHKSRTSLELFDSSGLDPSQLLNFIPPPHKKLIYSQQRIQNWAISTCGLYAMYFCQLCSSGVKSWNFLNRDFDQNFFKENDNKICEWAKQILAS